MGRKTVAKLEKAAANEAMWSGAFAQHNQKLKEKAQEKEKPVSVFVMPYIDKAIRNIADFKQKTKSNDRDKQLLELVRFLFGKYTVNQVLSKSWTAHNNDHGNRLNNQNTKALYRDWYICVATGGSFYKEYAKEFFTKKEAHTFLTCPHDLDIPQALVYAVAKSAGADDGYALRMARSKIHRMAFDDFWRGVVRFFVANRTDSIEQTNDLVDYIQFKHNENPRFTLFGSGYSVKALLIKTEEWHRALRRAKELGDIRWDGHAVSNSVFERKDQYGNDVRWVLNQILSSKELAAEGTRMRHCVLSYKQYCITGSRSIWQLLYVDFTGTTHNKLTIELDNNGTILQARGLANRPARPEELSVLKEWCVKEHFRLYNYL